MKRFFVIVLIITIIGSTLHFDELTKISFLSEHYCQHKLEHPQDGIFVFLYKHYILNQKAESENDKKRDSKLPFKSSQNYFSHFSPFTLESFSIIRISSSAIKLDTPFKNCIVLSIYFNIWQPPK